MKKFIAFAFLCILGSCKPEAVSERKPKPSRKIELPPVDAPSPQLIDTAGQALEKREQEAYDLFFLDNLESAVKKKAKRRKITRTYSDSDSDYEIAATYLGELETVNGNYAVVNAETLSRYREHSWQGNDFVAFFDSDGKLIGGYYTYSSAEIALRLNGSKVVFGHVGDGCDRTTQVDFYQDFPEEIFLECSERGGNVYKFTPSSKL